MTDNNGKIFLEKHLKNSKEQDSNNRLSHAKCHFTKFNANAWLISTQRKTEWKRMQGNPDQQTVIQYNNLKINISGHFIYRTKYRKNPPKLPFGRKCRIKCERTTYTHRPDDPSSAGWQPVIREQTNCHRRHQEEVFILFH